MVSGTDPGGTLTYQYWPTGELKSVSTPEGMVTTMTYDKNGNRLTIDDPSAGLITNTWYGNGRQKTMVTAEGNTTTWYYKTNGLPDYTVTDGKTTSYTYTGKGQVASISSPDGVSRTYSYYPNGRLQTVSESVQGVNNLVAIEYDSYGRVGKKTFNSDAYEEYEYQNGYLYRIKFNGTVVWQVTTIDEYNRLRAASVGGVAATWGYSATSNLLSQIKATGVQQYDYSFDGATGNLNSRQNSLRSLSETFGYDTEKLDRLTSVTGPSAQTLGYQGANKGNILTKTDAGTYEYDPVKKYALKMITNGVNISTTDQDITYTAFNKVHQITEGSKTAEFIYNADNQRIRMVLKNNGSVTKTRWYFGGSCEREQVGSSVTEYIWIGGDAYTAVAVAKKIGTGSWVVYNIFRDHLGTITHLKNGSTIDEYSFDAWGRRRDKDNWSYTLSGEPALFADRGFTCHEFLSDFNLYNMNGRLYDPVVGRFLSPDPYIADPSFTQSYNRYSYVLNNPLKYNDPTGELPFIAWLGIAWAGNYLMGVADNHINKGMSLKDAFRNTDFVAGVNFSPSDMSRSNKFGFSSIQVDAQKAALHEEKMLAYLTAIEKSQSGRGKNGYGDGTYSDIYYWTLALARAKMNLPADAYSVAGNIDIVGGLGADMSFPGSLRVNRGNDRGKSTNIFDFGIAAGGDVGASVVVTSYYFVGDINQLKIGDFEGSRWSLSLGFSFIVEFGGGFMVAPVPGKGYIIGKMGHIGVSPPGPSGNISWGQTIFY